MTLWKGFYAIILVMTFLFICDIQEAVAKRSGRVGKVKQLSASLEGNTIVLEWHPVPGCDGYRIYHAPTRKATKEAFWFDLDDERTKFLFEDLVPGTRYSVWVSVLRGHKEGPPSARVNFEIPQKTAKGRSDAGNE